MKRHTNSMIVLLITFSLLLNGCTPREHSVGTEQPIVEPTLSATAEFPIEIIPCTVPRDCPGVILIANLYGQENILEYNTEYPLTISPETRPWLYYGWCAVDDATLEDNLAKMTIDLTVDGYSYFDALQKEYFKVPTADDPNIKESCYGIGGAITGFQSGHTYRVVFGVVFTSELSDGWDTYPAQDQRMIYLLTADANFVPTENPEKSNVVIPSSWYGIPIFPLANSGQEEMGDFVFTTIAPPVEITSYYEMEMTGLGWELRPDMMEKIPTDLAFYKDGTYVFFKYISDSGVTQVMIHLFQE